MYVETNRFRRPLHGFTLVELLVVISIIGLLISLLLPALAAARDEAQHAICASNLRSLGQGVFIYVDQYRGQYPIPDMNDWPFGNLAGTVTPGGTGANKYGPWGFGLLYLTKIVSTPTVYYCTQPGYFGPLDTPNYFIGSLGKTGGPPDYGSVYLGYNYYYQRSEENQQNGNTTGSVINPSTRRVQNRYLEPNHPFTDKPTDPGSTILGSDITVSDGGIWNTWSDHFGSTGSPEGCNDLYNDGSVDWITPGHLYCRYSLILDFWQ